MATASTPMAQALCHLTTTGFVEGHIDSAIQEHLFVDLQDAAAAPGAAASPRRRDWRAGMSCAQSPGHT